MTISFDSFMRSNFSAFGLKHQLTGWYDAPMHLVPPPRNSTGYVSSDDEAYEIQVAGNKTALVQPFAPAL